MIMRLNLRGAAPPKNLSSNILRSFYIDRETKTC